MMPIARNGKIEYGRRNLVDLYFRELLSAPGLIHNDPKGFQFGRDIEETTSPFRSDYERSEDVTALIRPDHLHALVVTANLGAPPFDPVLD
jgi:hypothetical protein